MILFFNLSKQGTIGNGTFCTEESKLSVTLSWQEKEQQKDLDVGLASQALF